MLQMCFIAQISERLHEILTVRAAVQVGCYDVIDEVEFVVSIAGVVDHPGGGAITKCRLPGL